MRHDAKSIQAWLRYEKGNLVFIVVINNQFKKKNMRFQGTRLLVSFEWVLILEIEILKVHCRLRDLFAAFADFYINDQDPSHNWNI